MVADPTITCPVEVLGDSSYATGDMLDVPGAKMWTPVVKPWPIKPAVEGGSTIDGFTHGAVGST